MSSTCEIERLQGFSTIRRKVVGSVKMLLSSHTESGRVDGPVGVGAGGVTEEHKFPDSGVSRDWEEQG